MISLSKIPYIHRIYMVLANPTYQTCLALEKLTSVPCDNSILCCIYLLFTNYQVQFKFPVLNGSKFTNYQVQFSVPVLNSSKARMYCSTSHEQPCHDVQAILSRRAGNPVTTCSCHDVPAFLSQRAGNPVTTCRQPCHDVQATLSRRAGNPVAPNAILLGLTRAVHVWCSCGIFGREIIKYMAIYCVHIRIWPP
jgi:hypothetical protein